MAGGVTLIALFIWLLLALVTETQCHQCQKYLSWAPRSPRSVFMAMFNHAHCHSWTTRHPITLRPMGKSTIELPRNIPFAFWCGACFARSSLNASLSLTLHPEGSMVSEPLKSSRGGYHHSVSDSTECILSYGLTEPLMGRGKIRCRLEWGVRRQEESLSFSVRGASVIEEGPTLEVETTDSRGAALNCPPSDLRDKRNIVRVWYYSDGPTTLPVVAKPTLDANITFWPKLAEEEVVACAVYDLTKGTPVWRRTFRVRAARPQHVGAGQSEASPSRAQVGFFSLNRTILLGTLVAVGVVVIVALSCLSLGVCPCQRRAQRPPAELTKQNLLPIPGGSRNKPATQPELVQN